MLETDFFASLHHLPAATAVTRLDDNSLVFANRPLLHLLDMASQDVMSMSRFGLSKNYEALSTSWEGASPETIHNHQDELKTSQGFVAVESSARRVELDNAFYCVEFFRPISLHEPDAISLNHSDIQLTDIFDSAQVGLMLLDGNRDIILANQRLAEIAGYESADDLIGLSALDLHVDQNHYEAYRNRFYELLRHRQKLHIEYQLKRKDGQLIWCHFSGKALDRHVPADLNKGLLWVVDDITHIKETEQALQNERDLFASGPTLIFQWRPEAGWPIDYCSANVKEALGFSASEMMADDFCFADLIHPDDQECIANEVSGYLAEQQQSFEQTYRLRNKEGQYREFFDHTRVDYGRDGSAKVIYGYMIDLTEHFEAERKVHAAEERSRLLLESSNEGIFGIDLNGVTTFANPAAAKMLGYKVEELVGQNNHGRIHVHHDDPDAVSNHNCRMMMPMKTGVTSHVDSEVLWRQDGSSFPVEYWSTPIVGRDEDVVGAVVTFHDISQRLEKEEQINQLAFHDHLSGLPNRRLFTERLDYEMQRDKRAQKRCAVLLLDIDHFKEVNDTLGHPAGDQLIIQVANRLSPLMGASDTFARIGGDEFAVLMVEADDVMSVSQLATRLIDSMSETFMINGHSIKTNLSIGIEFSDSVPSSELLIARCDMALYEAKGNGRGRFVFYENDMALEVQSEADMVLGLKHALEQSCFELYYQPQMDLQTERVSGIESLIRWFPEDGKSISPAQFIPVAEKRGLIHQITLWVVRQMASDLPMLKQSGFTGRIAFNLSAIHLMRSEWLLEVANLLKELIVDLSEVELEITETAYMQVSENALMILQDLRAQGLAIAIDDFGTGYSSLASLRKVRSNYLKVDKQFIDGLPSNEDDLAIVNATLSMAHSLGKKVIAEGVETVEQLNTLRSLGCDEIQGYHFSQPLALANICQFLSKSS